METGNPATIRRINRNAILEHLREHASCSRAKLAKHLKLAPATVTVVIGELIADGLVIETGASHPKSRSPGRPSREIGLNPNAGCVIGLVLDTIDHQLSIIATSGDYAGHCIGARSFIFAGDLSESHVVDAVFNVVTELTEQLPQDANVISVGIGIPGVVVDEEILYAPRLPDLVGLSFHPQLSSKLDLPVLFENNVNLALYFEARTEPRLQTINYAHLLISEGVGAGISLANNVWKSKNWSGEIGHVPVPVGSKEILRLEMLIGLDGRYVHQLKRLGVVFSGQTIQFPDLRHTDEIKLIINEYVDYLLLGIQSLNASIGLEEVILNSSEIGFLNHIYPLLLQKIQSSLLQIDVEVSKHSESSLVEGAAIFALKHSLEKLQYRRTP